MEDGEDKKKGVRTKRGEGRWKIRTESSRMTTGVKTGLCVVHDVAIRGSINARQLLQGEKCITAVQLENFNLLLLMY